jgi:hypothetical protein
MKMMLRGDDGGLISVAVAESPACAFNLTSINGIAAADAAPSFSILRREMRLDRIMKRSMHEVTSPINNDVLERVCE